MCIADGERSVLRVGGTFVTAMAGDTFYDEDGRLHRHDPNRRVTDYECSRGHRFAESEDTPCGVSGCPWLGRPRELQ